MVEQFGVGIIIWTQEDRTLIAPQSIHLVRSESIRLEHGPRLLIVQSSWRSLIPRPNRIQSASCGHLISCCYLCAA